MFCAPYFFSFILMAFSAGAEKELAAHGLQRGAHLGTGSFGSVFSGTDVATGEHIALKYLPVDTAELDRITMEIGILSDLNHPVIVRLRRVVRLPSHLVLVMQRALGGDLRDLLESQPSGFLDEGTVRLIVSQLCRGLRYMHSKKVIHRDLKLENVLLKDEMGCEVLLADFGLSSIRHNANSRLNLSGSLYYMVRLWGLFPIL